MGLDSTTQDKELYKTMLKIISKYGVEVDLIAQELEKLKPGQTCTYEALTKVCGVNVLQRRTILDRARRQLLSSKQMVFEAVAGIGLRRLFPDEVTAKGITTVKRIGKAARRGMKVVSSVEFSDLTSTGKVQHAVGLTVLNLVSQASSPSGRKAIESKLSPKSDVLPLAKTLAALA